MKPPCTRGRPYLKILKSAVATAGILSVCLLPACTFVPREGANPKPAYVATVAGVNGEFGEPFGIAVSGNTLYLSDGEKDRVWRLGPNGPEVFAGGLDTPSGITFDTGGNMIVADTGSNTIRSINTEGEVSILAGTIEKRGTDDGESINAAFSGPIGVATSTDGRVYVADTYNDRIRVIEGGRVSTLAGSSRGFKDDTGVLAMFNTPTGLAVWGDKLLVADTGNGRIRVVENNGEVWTLAGNGDATDGLLSSSRLFRPTAITVDSSGTIYFTDGDSIRHINPSPFPAVHTISRDVRGFEDGSTSGSRFNRPSGVAFSPNGELFVADSDNGLVRKITAENAQQNVTAEQLAKHRGDPIQFRMAAPARWPYDPPDAPRDIAGTLGEIRGEIGPKSRARFHNGLDIAGAYGETARFIRDEKVLHPQAAEDFDTLREMLRMPTLGYIHIRLGRDQSSTSFDDGRFLFERDPAGKIIDIRVPRGARFAAGEPIGTLNAMNHVHLIAGRSGYEMNALDALIWPGLKDERPPMIEKVILMDENWREFETGSENSRIKLTRKARVIVRAFDQMDGNADRRRLGVYLVRWGLRSESPVTHAVMGEWKFDRLPAPNMVPMLYAPGSRSGAQGGTVFNYIVTNSIDGENVTQGFLDPEELSNGTYTLSVQVADYFGNTTEKNITFEVDRGNK